MSDVQKELRKEANLEELVFLLAYLLSLIWFVTPAIRIWRSSPIDGGKKAYWAIGTFLPVVLVISMAKLFQLLAETQYWARVVFDSQVGAFVLIMSMAVGNWIILGIHDHLYRKDG